MWQDFINADGVTGMWPSRRRLWRTTRRLKFHWTPCGMTLITWIAINASRMMRSASHSTRGGRSLINCTKTANIMSWLLIPVNYSPIPCDQCWHHWWGLNPFWVVDIKFQRTHLETKFIFHACRLSQRIWQTSIFFEKIFGISLTLVVLPRNFNINSSI